MKVNIIVFFILPPIKTDTSNCKLSGTKTVVLSMNKDNPVLKEIAVNRDVLLGLCSKNGIKGLDNATIDKVLLLEEDTKYIDIENGELEQYLKLKDKFDIHLKKE